jgi:hypothetical protein
MGTMRKYCSQRQTDRYLFASHSSSRDFFGAVETNRDYGSSAVLKVASPRPS